MKSSDSPTRATPPQWVNTAALNIAREFYAQEYSESDHARLVSIIVSALAEASCEATPPPQADVLNRLIESQRLEFVRIREMFSESNLSKLADRIQQTLSDGSSVLQEYFRIRKVLVDYFTDAQPRGRED
jgi:hypothetical protein